MRHGLEAAEFFLLEGISDLQSAQIAANEDGDTVVSSDIQHALGIIRAIAQHVKEKLEPRSARKLSQS